MNNITINYNKPIQPTLNADPGQKNKIFAVILIAIAVIFIILYSRQDSNSFNTISSYLYAIVIIILLFFILLFFLNTFNPVEKSMSITFLFVVLIILISILIVSSISNSSSSSGFILNGILLIIILLGMAIFYITFLNKPAPRSTWTSFFINLIFYIPCLVSDLFNYLVRDFISTPKSAQHLILIEIGLIIFYVVLYPRIKKTTTNNGVVLLHDPVLLNDEKSIDTELYKSFFNKKEDPITNTVTIDSPFRSTFSISMWIYLNIQPFTQLSYSKEIDIFDYKSPDKGDDISGSSRSRPIYNSHPKVTYKNNKNGLDKYIFYLGVNEINETVKYMVSLPHQKWNNIVFNYRDGAVDIFINGEFETTISLPIPIEFSNYDTIKIGNNDTMFNSRSGVYGSICNIVYYKNILSKNEIVNNYNLLSVNNPPI
jgi:4-amino-4-deoxy-L-arabinose transferase-like glycosyltransferase